MTASDFRRHCERPRRAQRTDAKALGERIERVRAYLAATHRQAEHNNQRRGAIALNAFRDARDDSGLSKIIAKHGPEVLETIVEGIARGKAVVSNQGFVREVKILYKDHKIFWRPFFRADKQGKVQVPEAWVITGFRTGKRSQTDIQFDLSKLDRLYFGN